LRSAIQPSVKKVGLTPAAANCSIDTIDIRIDARRHALPLRAVDAIGERLPGNNPRHPP
jgi:hypothetical protein